MDDGDEIISPVENEEQFWEELDRLFVAPCRTSEEIDDVLRSFLSLTTQSKKEYVQSEYDYARCSYILLDSKLFNDSREYVRRQMLYCLLQDDDVDVLHLAASILLFDGRSDETIFEMMQREGVFPRIVELVRDSVDDEAGTHRLLLQLLYEMSRMQRLGHDDLTTIDDAFVLNLLQMIEGLSDDVEDPYHYPIIRVLLVLNEQYMCLANDTSTQGAMTNRLLKLLSAHGPSYRTFGENLILLLNRESALSAQLLILKLLYLLFTTQQTFEYFYTNDLHVLVDVIIRNLLDLEPSNDDYGASHDGGERDGQKALRHTYLRVLCVLLKNTQLARPGLQYKREEIRKLLHLLITRSSAHFAPVDETDIRLVIRVKQVEWIREEGDEQDQEIKQKLAEVVPAGAEEKAAAKKMIGMSMDEAGVSSLSVVDMSAKVTREKPSVPAPRRNRRKRIDGANAHSNGQQTLLQVERGGTMSSRRTEEPLGGRSPFSDDNVDS